MEPKDGGQVRKVTDISTKRPDTVYAIKSKMGMFCYRCTLDADNNVDGYIDCVEMLTATDGKSMFPSGTLIGNIEKLPNEASETTDAEDYFLFEVSTKSAYYKEYVRVMSGLVTA